jgi:hypothetical protein
VSQRERKSIIKVVTSPSIIMWAKSKMIKWAGHVAFMGDEYKNVVKSEKEITCVGCRH